MAFRGSVVAFSEPEIHAMIREKPEGLTSVGQARSGQAAHSATLRWRGNLRFPGVALGSAHDSLFCVGSRADH